MSTLPTVTSLLVLVALWGFTSAAPEVTCPWGTVSGVEWRAGNTGPSYQAFLAIPYALPPVGALRFQKPQPHPGVSSTFNATSPGLACPQAFLASTGLTSEDCLTLNVFRPVSASPSSPLPVLIWVHGGSFTFGSTSTYDPWRLVAVNNLVVVSVQYRLGPLGFLYTGSTRIPGNRGLWDQRLALQWVKDNIAAFGGDPSNVTLMGESAGSASVTHHMLSPQSQGLFRRVIGQSGAAQVFWANVLDPVTAARRLAEAVNCTFDLPDNESTMLECLGTKTADELVVAGNAGWGLWYPTADGDFIPQDPRLLLRNTTYLQSVGFFDKDLMMGVNNNEGVDLFLVLGPTWQPSATLADQLLSTYLTMTYGSFNPAILTAAAWKYTRSRDASSQSDVTAQEMMDIDMDFSFLGSIVEYTRAHAQQNAGSGRTYMYLFDYYPTGVKYGGMGHVQDTVFLFTPSYNMYNTSWGFLHVKETLDARDENVTQIFARFLSDFARSGDPSPALAGNLASGEWPQFEMVNQSYLAFSNTSQTRSVLGDERVSFHLDLIPRLQSDWEALMSTTPLPTTPPLPDPVPHDNPLTPTQSLSVIIALGVISSALLIVACIAIIVACKFSTSSKYTVY